MNFNLRKLTLIGVVLAITTGALAATVERTVTGPVLQVQPSERILTLRDPATRQRIPIYIPENATITMQGRPARLSQFKRGHEATIRFTRTDGGRREAVVARIPEPAAVVELPPVAATPEPMAMPKTSSLRYAPLFLGLGWLAIGAALFFVRSRRAAV